VNAFAPIPPNHSAPNHFAYSQLPTLHRPPSTLTVFASSLLETAPSGALVNLMNAIEELNTMLPELLLAFPAIEILYVFGSQASGRAVCGSDIDVGVLVGEGVLRHDPLLDLKVALFLEDRLVQAVDVVILNRSSVIFQHEVVRTGKRLYESSAQQRRSYELANFKAYTDVRHYQLRRLKGAFLG
jgi:uncharacterized protein